MFLAGILLLGGYCLFEAKKPAEAEGHEVEITFASELQEGDKRALKVGEKDEDKVLIAKY